MKKFILIAFICTAIISCKSEDVNYVTFTGEISNLKETDTLLTLVNTAKTIKKEIKINSNGAFKDTLTIDKADHFSILINGKSNGFVFLRNGFDLEMSADNNSFFKTTSYTGKGATTTNYLLAQYKLGGTFGDPRAAFALDKEEFTKKINSFRSKFDSLKKAYKDIDTLVARKNGKQNEDFFNSIEKSYDQQHAAFKNQAEAKLKLAKGKPSPKFKNYVNFKGGKKSLSSFKGKYVYIDVWATWCKPCIAQIPSLKILEKKYHNKNIEFLSISIDDERTAGSWDNALAKWKKMVKNKNLTGVQLYAGKDIAFMKEYQVTGIPRFILIDPKGNIVSANAPRPSDPSLEILFKEAGI